MGQHALRLGYPIPRAPRGSVACLTVALALFCAGCPRTECEATGPFSISNWEGICIVDSEDDFFPGATGCLWGFFGSYVQSYCSDPTVNWVGAQSECVDVPGGAFCRNLVYGDICEQVEPVKASDVDAIAECIDAWAARQGIDLSACTENGVVIEDGGCVQLAMGLDRLEACLLADGPQTLTDGRCFKIFMEQARPFDPSCPWWSSDECYESYLP